MAKNKIYDFMKAKERKKNILKQTTEDTYAMTKTDIRNVLSEVIDRYEEEFDSVREAWIRNNNMFEILHDSIFLNGIEDLIIDQIQEQLKIECEHGFGEHDEGSYNELLHELKAKRFFIEQAKEGC